MLQDTKTMMNMMKSMPAFLLAAVALVQTQSPVRLLAAQAPPEWQRYSDSIGRFSVLVPGVLAAQPPSSDNAGTYYTFTLAQEGRRAYVVAYGDMTYDMNDPQGELDANRDSFVKSLSASVVSEHRFSSAQPVGQVPAAEFTCQSAEWECRARTFILGRRGYQIVVLNRPGSASALDADRFLDSFQILPAR
jgi:hypothetical protein